MYFRQPSSLTKHVSQHLTLIEAKISIKILFIPFSKNFTSVCPPPYEGQVFFSKIAFWRKK